MPEIYQTRKKIPVIVMLSLGVAIFFWSSSYVAIRSALGSYSPEGIAVFRMVIASLVLLGVGVFWKIKLPALKDIPSFAIAGFVGISLYHFGLNAGEKTITAGTASFIASTTPVFTAIFSALFFKQKMKFWGWLGIFISLSGVALISFSESGWGKLNIGTLLVTMTAISGSIYVFYQQKLLKKYTALEVTTYTMTFGAIFLLFYSKGIIHEIRVAEINHTLEVIYLGIFPAAVAYLIWTIALPKFNSATQISTWLYLMPVFTIIISAIWLSELPKVVVLIGGGITMLGVILTNMKG